MTVVGATENHHCEEKIMTKSTVATVREVLEKVAAAASPEMRFIGFRVAREHLRDEHGIVVKPSTLARIANAG